MVCCFHLKRQEGFALSVLLTPNKVYHIDIKYIFYVL